MKTKPLTKITLTTLIVVMLMTTTVGDIRAAGGPECSPNGGAVNLPLRGFTPYRNQILNVFANGVRVGQIAVDANGNGDATFPAQTGVNYNYTATSPSGENIPLGSVTCQPTGPSGPQGQTTPGTSSTVGNTAGNNGCVGDPISTSSGEHYFQMPLIDLGGLIPLRFTLNYASGMDKSAGEANDPFGGDYFSHNFHAALKLSGENSLVIFFGSGNLINFKKANNKWQVEKEETAYQLQEAGNQFSLFDPIAGRIYIFTKANKDYAWLTRIEDRDDNTLAIINDGNGRVTRVQDGLGRSLTFTYADPSPKWRWPHLAQVTDHTGRAVKFSYTTIAEGAMTTHLTSVADTQGGITKFTYSGNNTTSVVAAMTLPLGNTPYTQKYAQLPNGLWRASEEKDASGNVTTINFGEGGVATITDPLGNKSQHVYKDGQRLDTVKDSAGKAASFEYDSAGRRISITDRTGGTTQITYHDPSGNMATITNARGETITFTYAAQTGSFTFYNLTKIEYPDKAAEQFTPDLKGNVIARVDRAGGAWKYTYNARGQVTTITNPANGVTTLTYNNDSTLASRKDSETGETLYAYDALKRLTKITLADKSAFQFSYDARDRLLSITDANNHATQFAYDANGNVIKVTDADGKESLYAYDVMNRLTKATNRLGKNTARVYDALGRVTSTTNAAGQATNFSYDSRGWLNAVTLGDSAWKLGYDDEGRITTTTTPLGFAAQIKRDKAGAVVSVTNPMGQTTIYARDALNRITRVTDPLNRATHYSYDARGWLNSVTPPDLGTAKYDYDATGNLKQITDLNGQAWSFTYSPMGRLLTRADPLKNVWKYSYDALGRLIEVIYPDAITRKATYDAAGNLTLSKYSDGTEFKHGYDSLNRLVSTHDVKLTRDAAGQITNHESLGVGYATTYDDAGRIKTLAYHNGAFTVTYTYDSKTGLLTQVSDSLTQTQINFSYDKDFRLVGVARSNKVNTALTWDNAGRLTGIRDAKTSEVLNLHYTLNAAGQVTGVSMNAPLDPASNLKLQTSNFQVDAASQINNAGYKYDAQGRLIESPNGAFKWNAASQLSGINQAQSAVSLTYNGMGDVASRKEGEKTTRYLYNYALGLNPILAEAQDSKDLKPERFYVWSPSGSLLYMIDSADGNKVYHYHFDRTGSTLALTDSDGKVTDSYAYDPYGKLLAREGKNAQPFTFVGKWGVRQEGASGTLYQMRARYYDAITARFLSRAPETFPPIKEARELNPYVYVINNPISLVDPTGHPAEFNDLWRFNLDNSEYEIQDSPPSDSPNQNNNDDDDERHIAEREMEGFFTLLAHAVFNTPLHSAPAPHPIHTFVPFQNQPWGGVSTSGFPSTTSGNTTGYSSSATSIDSLMTNYCDANNAPTSGTDWSTIVSSAGGYGTEFGEMTIDWQTTTTTYSTQDDDPEWNRRRLIRALIQRMGAMSNEEFQRFFDQLPQADRELLASGVLGEMWNLTFSWAGAGL